MDTPVGIGGKSCAEYKNSETEQKNVKMCKNLMSDFCINRTIFKPLKN